MYPFKDSFYTTWKMSKAVHCFAGQAPLPSGNFPLLIGRGRSWGHQLGGTGRALLSCAPCASPCCDGFPKALEELGHTLTAYVLCPLSSTLTADHLSPTSSLSNSVWPLLSAMVCQDFDKSCPEPWPFSPLSSSGLTPCYRTAQRTTPAAPLGRGLAYSRSLPCIFAHWRSNRAIARVRREACLPQSRICMPVRGWQQAPNKEEIIDSFSLLRETDTFDKERLSLPAEK